MELNEYEFPSNKVANIGTQMTMLIEKNYYLNKSARDAYRSYLLAYASHSHKDIFKVLELDLQGVGKGFGFSVPPRVDLNLSSRGPEKRGRNKLKRPPSAEGGRKEKFGSSGHAFFCREPLRQKGRGGQTSI